MFSAASGCMPPRLTCCDARDTMSRLWSLLNTHRMSFIADSRGSTTARGLLAADEPAAFSVLDCPAPRYPVLLVCDHASARIPRSLQQLGLADEVLVQHIASDIGAADVVRALHEKLQVPAVLTNYSRLVIDCNRPVAHMHSISEISDEVVVPGNQKLSPAERALRFAEVFKPYHQAIAEQLAMLAEADAAPVVIAIHSFTPLFAGFKRPWHCGILWDKDPRLAVPMLAALRALQAFEVGDNEPYSGRHPEDYTIDTHAEAVGLPHVAIELRQDLIAHAAGAEQWGGILAAVVKPLLADPQLFTRFKEAKHDH
jgi:predicted N-formylglutamate amidohydrolase